MKCRQSTVVVLDNSKYLLSIDHRLAVIVVDIMNRKPRQAWELYLKMETSSESFSLLQVIANDCYKVCNNMRVCELVCCFSYHYHFND